MQFHILFYREKLQGGTAQYNATRRNTARYEAGRRDTARCRAVRCSVVIVL